MYELWVKEGIDVLILPAFGVPAVKHTLSGVIIISHIELILRYGVYINVESVSLSRGGRPSDSRQMERIVLYR